MLEKPEVSVSRDRLPNELRLWTENKEILRPAVARKRSSGWKATLVRGEGDSTASGVHVCKEKSVRKISVKRPDG